MLETDVIYKRAMSEDWNHMPTAEMVVWFVRMNAEMEEIDISMSMTMELSKLIYRDLMSLYSSKE
jgi:hypothetical protein